MFPETALVTGVAIGVAVAQGRVHTPEVITLAVGTAIAFAAIDLCYSLSGRIAPIYLADAAVEGVLLAGLAATRSRQPPPLGASSS